MIEFIHYIEIPIRVYAEYQPEERATCNYPGCPSAMEIEDIEICLPDQNDTPIKNGIAELKDWIFDNYAEELKDEAWEYKD